MASYPTAVKSYTTKVDGAGNKIFAAHINDIQAEITAIEDGLLNGTAPMNSSRITAPQLQISGNSTFVGSVQGAGSTWTTLSVSGNSTFAGTLTVATTSRFSIRLTHSVAQNVNTATATGLNFDTERFKNGMTHSTTTNSSRLTFPVAGTYLIGAQAAIQNSTAGTDRQLRILINDATVIALNSRAASGVLGTPHLSVTTIYQAAANDYATMVVFQDSGSTMGIPVAAQYQCEFWATMVGV